MIEALMEDPVVQTAGAIGRLFRIDPITHLCDGGDEFVPMVREAAFRWVANEEKKQNEEQERKSKASRGGAGRRPSRGRRR